MSTQLSRRFDRTRQEIVNQFRHRIAIGKRTRLNRSEREELTLLLVDDLIRLHGRGEDSEAAIRDRCQSEIALLEEGYPQSSINSTYLPAYTRVIRDAVEAGRLPLSEQNSYEHPWTKRDGQESGVERRHYALDYLTYDTGTQTALRQMTTANNNRRQDALQPVDLDTYLETVQALAQDPDSDPESVAIALAALTGRRHTEIVSLGHFAETRYPYLVHFEGQQKKAQGEAVGFNILTLVPVKEMLPVFERFRAMPQVQALIGLHHDHPEIDAFNARINRRTQKLFGDTGIVPVPVGFSSVSIHRLRGLYGAIAIHFFCPNNRNPHRFLQHHLGHVLDVAADAQNSRATDHYFHYYLTRHGRPITARGVKIPSVGLPPSAAVEVLTPPPVLDPPPAVELTANPEPPPAMPPKKTHISLYAADKARLKQLFSQVAPDAPQSDAMTHLLDWIEHLQQQTQQQQEQQRTINTRLAQQLEQLSSAQMAQAKHIEWATERMTALEQENAQLRQQIAHLPTTHANVETLEAELAAAQTKLAQIQNLFGGQAGESDAGDEAGERQAFVPPTPTPTPTSASPATTSAPPAPQPSPVPQKRRSRAVERAKAIFEVICRWNETHPHHAFAITPTLLKNNFGINARAANEFADDYDAEIQRANALIGVEPGREKYFNRGKDYAALVEFVEQAQPSSP